MQTAYLRLRIYLTIYAFEKAYFAACALQVFLCWGQCAF